MDTTILIGLAGQTTQFRLEQTAYTRLTQYLDRAAARLHDDPDRTEVLGDLERSVGERLAISIGASERVVTAAEMESILEAIGAVDAGADQPTGQGSRPHGDHDRFGSPPRRRLQRIREGQAVAGVCTGIAAYAEVDVDWVRWTVVLGTLFSAGLLGLVYIALVLILPIAPRPEAHS
jgi:phage shock protein C